MTSRGQVSCLAARWSRLPRREPTHSAGVLPRRTCHVPWPAGNGNSSRGASASVSVERCLPGNACWCRQAASSTRAVSVCSTTARNSENHGETNQRTRPPALASRYPACGARRIVGVTAGIPPTGPDGRSGLPTASLHSPPAAPPTSRYSFSAAPLSAKSAPDFCSASSVARAPALSPVCAWATAR